MMNQDRIFQFQQSNELNIRNQDNQKNQNIIEIQSSDQNESKSGQNNLQQLNYTLIRVPFYSKSLQNLQKVISSQILKQIQDKQDTINLVFNNSNKKSFNVNLEKKKLVRPIQLLKTKKFIHKKTGKAIKIIKKAFDVDFLYDYEQFGDFVNVSGTQILYNQKKYSLMQKDLLKQIKNYLSQKIHSKKQERLDNQSQKYLKLIQPMFFLKDYSFSPPNCDMLINKIKLKASDQSSQAFAKSITYEEQIPNPYNFPTPKFILETQLYKIISQYLQKRPCWLKNSLYYTLYQNGIKNFTINDFKNVMKYTAYTFRNGPWKHTFCKFGFDPKKQAKSIIYQSIAIKLKEKQVEDYENEIQEDVYDPTFQEISNKFIRSYQLCDITSETIRQIVQGKLISKEGECAKQHGWLTSSQHTKIMKVMKMSIQQ